MKLVKIEALLVKEPKTATHEGLLLTAALDAKQQINFKEDAFGLLSIIDEGSSISQYPFFCFLKGKNLMLDFGDATGDTPRESPANPLGDRYYQADLPDKPLELGQQWALRGGETRLLLQVHAIHGLGQSGT